MKKRVLIIVSLIVAGFVGWVVLGLVMVGRPYKIMSNSMLPFIGANEIVFCAKDDTRPPTYGDVVIYTNPYKKAEGAKYVKTIVGLAGDSIQMKNGVLWINRIPVPRRRMADFEIPESNGKSVPRYEETLPGGAKTLVLVVDPASRLNNTALVTVPADHIFVIGNNRDNSSDSRMASVHGPVPTKNVVCKMEQIEG